MTWVARARASRAAERSGASGIDHPRVAVEGVERGRDLGRVRGDPLGLLGRHGVLDDLGQADDGPGERRLGPVAERARDRGRRRQAGVGRLAQDRGDPGVGVLDVVDRVLVRLLLRELDVEVDGGRGRA